MSRKAIAWSGAFLVVALLVWNSLPTERPPAVPAPRKDVIPPGIIVTESAPLVPPPPSSGSRPGDPMLADYGKRGQSPQQDLTLIARVISGFLTIEKQAVNRPLSANEEWSAALRGLRPGTESWISENSPAFDARHLLVDRWGTPLVFHALGGKRWEIRSAGPDRQPWTEDDLLEKFSG